MSEGISRRTFLKLAGLASGLGAGIAAQPAGAAAPAAQGSVKAPLPQAKGPRLVVVGGGTAGLTIAKYAKKEYPGFDVVLVEKRDMYASCFSSNLLYSGLIDLEFLADRSFLDAARNNHYLFFNATCLGLDQAGRRLITSEGEIDYDYLVLAPGLSYDYARIGVGDPETEHALRTLYPGGFMMPTESIAIRRKIRDFKGGIFVQTVPGGNYRCLPAPYERVCMIAAYFKKHKIKAKVLVLDHNEEIASKAKGFHAAFDELYRDIVEYRPSVEIRGVDLAGKAILTEFDAIPFDEALIYPNVRGSVLLERLGLMDPASRQKEAGIDPIKYHVPGDERVYVAGDARPQPFSKSANTANTEGKYVAKLLAAHVQGKEAAWQSPQTFCFSMVNADPMEAISIDSKYVYDPKTKSFDFAPGTKAFEERDQDQGRKALEWAKGIYRDLFT